MSDTSTLAAGAALYQYQGSAFYIVGYNSKKLPKAVQNYSVTELELFGLVVNIYAFRQLLTNVYVTVRVFRTFRTSRTSRTFWTFWTFYGFLP